MTYDEWKSTDPRDAEEEFEENFDDTDYVICHLCHCPAPAETAHLHQEEWIGDDCCWDERLRSSE